jgi:hypothetical protein
MKMLFVRLTHPLPFTLYTLLFLLYALRFTLYTNPVSAQCTGPGPINLSDCYFNAHPGAKTLGTSPGSLISLLLPNIIVIAGVVLLMVVVVSGFFVIQDAGDNVSAQDLAKRKNIFSASLIGFLLVLSAYFILYIVGKITGVNFINPNLP